MASKEVDSFASTVSVIVAQIAYVTMALLYLVWDYPFATASLIFAGIMMLGVLFQTLFGMAVISAEHRAMNPGETVKWRRGKKILTWVYIIGYVGQVGLSGFATWSLMPLDNWLPYMTFQFAYAFFWPVLLALNLVGIRW